MTMLLFTVLPYSYISFIFAINELKVLQSPVCSLLVSIFLSLFYLVNGHCFWLDCGDYTRNEQKH